MLCYLPPFTKTNTKGMVLLPSLNGAVTYTSLGRVHSSTRTSLQRQSQTWMDMASNVDQRFWLRSCKTVFHGIYAADIFTYIYHIVCWSLWLMLNYIYIYAYIDPMGLVQFSTPLKTNMPPKDADFQKESQIPFSRSRSTTLCFFFDPKNFPWQHQLQVESPNQWSVT